MLNTNSPISRKCNFKCHIFRICPGSEKFELAAEDSDCDQAVDCQPSHCLRKLVELIHFFIKFILILQLPLAIANIETLAEGQI